MTGDILVESDEEVLVKEINLKNISDRCYIVQARQIVGFLYSTENSSFNKDIFTTYFNSKSLNLFLSISNPYSNPQSLISFQININNNN